MRLIFLAAVCSTCARPSSLPASAAAGSDIFLARDTETIEGRVPARATLASLLRAHRLREQLINTAVEVASSAFDPRRLRAAQHYQLERTLDGVLRSFEYEIDADRFLRIAAASPSEPERLTAEIVPYEKQHAIETVEGEINRATPSLFAAMQATGERPDLSIALAAIFAGEVDFNSELQPGDRFRLVVEKTSREGTFAGYGPIRFAELENDGRRYRAIRFTPPGGQPGYYDEGGRSLRRFFLKSPLKFEPRVTSKFSYSRLHPVFHERRAHLGVDFGAPAGAPVIAVANGVVVSAGMNGASGRMVHLRHASGYETMYLHLSSIPNDVRKGAHVQQGELIGRVGSSGLATGPHLDYRLRKNGVFVNPLAELKRLPPGEPIASDHVALFRAERDGAIAQLASPVRPAAPVQPAVVLAAQ